MFSKSIKAIASISLATGLIIAIGLKSQSILIILIIEEKSIHILYFKFILKLLLLLLLYIKIRKHIYDLLGACHISSSSIYYSVSMSSYIGISWINESIVSRKSPDPTNFQDA